MKHTPSNSQVVLRAEEEFDVERLREALRDLSADVEILPTQRTNAYVVEMGDEAKRSGDPRQVWQRVRERLADNCMVAPVLDDEAGEHHYPTGSISARFSRALTDDELERFAEAHELSVEGRNEWVPEQVSFRPRHPEKAYLPDVRAALERSADVARVWEETESYYSHRD